MRIGSGQFECHAPHTTGCLFGVVRKCRGPAHGSSKREKARKGTAGSSAKHGFADRELMTAEWTLGEQAQGNSRRAFPQNRA
jgi:hypothetical protein